MKILHLADLHLGKILQEQSFIEDQEYMLNKIIEKIREENLEENKFYKIILTGKRNFDFDESKILDILNIQNIIKI